MVGPQMYGFSIRAHACEEIRTRRCCGQSRVHDVVDEISQPRFRFVVQNHDCGQTCTDCLLQGVSLLGSRRRSPSPAPFGGYGYASQLSGADGSRNQPCECECAGGGCTLQVVGQPTAERGIHRQRPDLRRSHSAGYWQGAHEPTAGTGHRCPESVPVEDHVGGPGERVAGISRWDCLRCRCHQPRLTGGQPGFGSTRAVGGRVKHETESDDGVACAKSGDRWIWALP